MEPKAKVAAGAAARGKVLGRALELLQRVITVTLAYIILGGYCLSSVGAFIWIVYTSMKTDREILLGAWSLPGAFRWQNYVDAWQTAHIGTYFFNSAYISVVSTTITVLISAMAAYAIARIPHRMGKIILFYFLLSFMVSSFGAIVPLYYLVRSLHLMNSHLGLIILYASGVTFNIFILTGFFKTLPTELEESAALDGSSAFTTFWRVMLPLAQPGLLTVAIFTFLGVWNDFFTPLIFLRDRNLFTLPLGLLNLMTFIHLHKDMGQLFAGLMIVMMPGLIVFVILQERIMEGLTLGALKG